MFQTTNQLWMAPLGFHPIPVPIPDSGFRLFQTPRVVQVVYSQLQVQTSQPFLLLLLFLIQTR